MKRRAFLGKISTGSTAMWMGGTSHTGQDKAIRSFSYGKAKNLADILSKQGQVMLRFEIKSTNGVLPIPVEIAARVKKAKLERLKPYYFGNRKGSFSEKDNMGNFWASPIHPNILVAWIDEVSPDSLIIIAINGQEFSYKLEDLILRNEIHFKEKDIQVISNYLLDKEIGTLNPDLMGIKTSGGAFSIAILADTQGGDPEIPNAHPTRMKIHNAFAEDSINRVNELNPQPAFSLILGDVVDNQGEKQHFEAMHRYLKQIKSPLLYAIGNHETQYRAQFTPGYNMEEFNNYFAAQKAMNGLEWLLYSFNLGGWHFVVWPDPLRDNFWETHPHYFDWLEQDLEQHKNFPVIFMQHVPSHPVGIDPLINYAESVAVKRMLLDILSQHGQVKYIFSGHVHIPIKASFKTAVTFKGMKMINIPAAGYRPRAFGEEELHGGPSQGILVLQIEGSNAKAYFKTVTEEIYAYPEELPVFDENDYPLWLNYKWQLPAENHIRNGDFEKGLSDWARRYVYREDQHPSNLMEVRNMWRENSSSALYLYSRKRDYHIPGQDRLPQTINSLCQAVRLGPKPGILQLEFCLDDIQTDLKGWAGGFLWLEGFNGSSKLLNMAYWIGKATTMLSDKFTDNKELSFYHFQMPEYPGVWQKANINWAADYENEGNSFAELKLDKLIINLGTWHINDGDSQPFALYFDSLKMLTSTNLSGTEVNGKPISPTPEEKKWWLNKNEPFLHIAGEHRYFMATKN